MVLSLVCTIITLGIKIVLKNKLAEYEAKSSSSVVEVETAEQFIVAAEVSETSESEEEPAEKYEKHFREIDDLYARMTSQDRDMDLKSDYKKVSELWDLELRSLNDDISGKMTEAEKKQYYDSENTFLVSRNHECMKAVSHNKVSVMEEIDYLDRYIKLTREHCTDLVKDYASYLAS